MPYFNEGKFRAKIVLAQRSESKTNKTPQVELHIKLLAEIDKDGTEYEPPTTRFNPVVYLSLTPGTMGTPQEPGWVANVLKFIGFKGDFRRLAEVEEWEGYVWNAHKDDQNGRPQDRWEIDMPRGPQLKQQDESQARELNSLFGSIFKGSELPEKPKPSPESNEPAREVPTDDVNGAMDLRDDDSPPAETTRKPRKRKQREEAVHSSSAPSQTLDEEGIPF